MAIRVETNRYVHSAGHMPRGAGNWCFKIAGKEQWFRGSYSECKARAIKEAQKLKLFSIEVMP
jgi:hypothetical protein